MTALSARQLAEVLLKLPNPDVPVYNAHLLTDHVTMAITPVVWTAEKEGKVLLLDPDVYQAIRAIKTNSN